MSGLSFPRRLLLTITMLSVAICPAIMLADEARHRLADEVGAELMRDVITIA